jgi:hypothetical protein
MLAGLTLALVPVLVDAQGGPLVVVTDTGNVRDGLPVLTPDPGGLEVRRVLSRGFSGRLLRLYQLEQVFLATRGGPQPEPAYLALTSNQGGFPRLGFYLGDHEKRQTNYVVVSALFYQWATDSALRNAYRDDSFYEPFGSRRTDVSPAENVYLKMIYAFALGRPRDTRAAIACYKRAFPDEGEALDRVVRDALLGQLIPTSPEIWLANPAFRTGTTLFDQWRSQPRTHTFDLNAASLVDLLGVPGVSSATAGAILAGAPYRELADLRRAQGMTPSLYRTFERMAEDMRALAEQGSDLEGKLTMSGILLPYLWRALAGLTLGAGFGAWLYWIVGRPRWFRAVLNGIGASAVVLPVAWLAGTPPFVTLLAPALIFGVPGALWRWRKRRAIGAGSRVLVAWAAAALPAALLTSPLF